MNSKILGLLAIALTAQPMCANAQITTLEYQNTVTGSTTFYNYPAPPLDLTPQQFAAAFSSAPFAGTITASFTVTGESAGAFLTGAVNVVGYGGTDIDLVFDVDALGRAPGTLYAFNGSSGTVDVTGSHGAITGATMDLTFSSYNEPTMYLYIGPTNDSLYYVYADATGPCTQQGSDEPNPCTLGASNNSKGVWQVSRVPEIRPASAAAGLTLLLGGVAVLRGRRKLALSAPAKRTYSAPGR
jgi:hypothetical protein